MLSKEWIEQVEKYAVKIDWYENDVFFHDECLFIEMEVKKCRIK